MIKSGAQSDFSDLGAEPVSHAPDMTLAGIPNQLPKKNAAPGSDFSDLGAEPVEPGLQSGNPVGSMGKGALAAILGGANEQTLGLSGRILPTQQQALAKEYPTATTVGRIGSYFTPGVDEIGPASRIARGIGEGFEAGANAVKRIIPNTTATGGALTTITNLLKTPATLGATSGGLRAANDIASGQLPGKDVGEAASIALDPGALALGYTGAALGGVSRGTELPQKIYQTSGLLAGTESGKASEQATALMNAGVRTPFVQNLMDIASGRKPGGIAARVANAADEAGANRMAVISDAQNTAPNNMAQVQDITRPLSKRYSQNAGSISNPGQEKPYWDVLSRINDSVPSEGLSAQQLEDMLQKEKGTLRARKTAGGAQGVFNDPVAAGNIDATKALIQGGTGAQYKQIADIFGEQSPQLEQFKQANTQYGAAADAGRNLENISQAPGAIGGHGVTPMGAIERSLRKYALVPVATNLGSAANTLTNNMPYNSAGITALMSRIAAERAKQENGQ